MRHSSRIYDSIAFSLLGLALVGQGVWLALHRSLTLDESVTLFNSHAAFDGHFAKLFSDIHTPFFNVLMALWTGLFGYEVMAMKAFALVCGVIGLVAVFRLADRIAGRSVAWVAVTALSFSPVYVQYAQFGRSYVLFAATASVSSYFYLRLLDRDFAFRSKEMVGYLIATSLMSFSHMVAATILLAQGVHLLFVCRRDKRFSRLASWFKALVLLLIAYSPVAITILSRYDLRKDIPAIYSWVRMPTLADLAFSVRYFTEPFLLVQLAFGGLIAIAVFTNRSRATGYLVTWLVVPPLFLFFYSRVHHPVFIERGLFPSLIPFIVLVAIGIGRLFTKPIFSIFLVAVPASAGLIATIGNSNDDESWAALDSAIEDVRRGSEDSFFIRPGYAAPPFLFYFDRDCFFAADRSTCMASGRVHPVFDESITGGTPVTERNWFIGYGSEAVTNTRLIGELKANPAFEVSEIPRRLESLRDQRMRGFEVILFAPKR
ncbi:MAG: glycosyltransferase family 39 protein [Bdellovibrionota bacterium]